MVIKEDYLGRERGNEYRVRKRSNTVKTYNILEQKCLYEAHHCMQNK